MINQAERIVWSAGWCLQEQAVLEHLAGTKGLARARFDPRSEVIQLVTYDGEHLGHGRREGPHGPNERWVAVLKDHAQPAGTYRSPLTAAKALTQACGKAARKTG